MPGREPAALRAFGQRMERRRPGLVISGIVSYNTPRYGRHHCINDLPADDYTVRDEGDRRSDGADPGLSVAIDFSMPTAMMIETTQLWLASFRDQDDPRLNWWAELIGTPDGTAVVWVNPRTGAVGTSDITHRWHLHAGLARVFAELEQAMYALESVLMRETTQQWRANGGVAPAPERETEMFIGQATDGQRYLCDGMTSRPITAKEAGDLQHLASTGWLTLAAGGSIRGGFYPGAFGVVATPADNSALLAALSTKLAQTEANADARALADVGRDELALAAITALAVAGGLDVAPVLAALDARQAELLAELASLRAELVSANEREQRAAQAEADALAT